MGSRHIEVIERLSKHSTLLGKFWVTTIVLLRFAILTLFCENVWSDDRYYFNCNTKEVGCDNICFNDFVPMANTRLWSIQIIAVSVVPAVYLVYVFHITNKAVNETKESNKRSKDKASLEKRLLKKEIMQKTGLNQQPNPNLQQATNSIRTTTSTNKLSSSAKTSTRKSKKRKTSISMKIAGDDDGGPADSSDSGLEDDDDGGADLNDDLTEKIKSVTSHSQMGSSRVIKSQIHEQIHQQINKMSRKKLKDEIRSQTDLQNFRNNLGRDASDQIKRQSEIEIERIVEIIHPKEPLWYPGDGFIKTQLGQLTAVKNKNIYGDKNIENDNLVNRRASIRTDYLENQRHANTKYNNFGYNSKGETKVNNYFRLEKNIITKPLALINRCPEKFPAKRQINLQRIWKFYYLQVLVRTIVDSYFIYLQFTLYSYKLTVPQVYYCNQKLEEPCMHVIECFVSRAVEKSVFVWYMTFMAVLSVFISFLELYSFGFDRLIQLFLGKNMKTVKTM